MNLKEYCLLPGYVAKIGRSDINDIVKTDLHISRLHCTVAVSEDAQRVTLHAQDKKTAFTFVNGGRLKRGTSSELKSGDSVGLGNPADPKVTFKLAKEPLRVVLSHALRKTEVEKYAFMLLSCILSFSIIEYWVECSSRIGCSSLRFLNGRLTKRPEEW